MIAAAATTTTTADPAAAAAGMVMLVFLLVWVAVCVLSLASMWRLFTKADEPGWAVLVPIYNTVVLLRIVGRPAWWLVLMLVPVVNIAVMFVVAFDTARAYGKPGAFGLLLVFLPFVGYPLLAFGDAVYQGPVAG